MAWLGYIQDTLQAAVPADVLFRPDSLGYAAGSVAAGLTPAADPLTGVFGASSYRIYETMPAAVQSLSISDDTLYQLGLLCLLFLYAYVIFAYRGETLLFLRTMFSRKTEGYSGDDNQSVLTGFTNVMGGVLLLSLGLSLAKAAELWPGGPGYDASPYGIAPILLVLAIAAAAGCINLLQYLFMVFVGKLTFSDVFIRRLMWKKRMFLSLFALFAAPAAILMGLAPAATATVLGYVLAACAVVVVIWFSIKVMNLFVREKVSILFWILYLCTVELMPVGIAVLATLRNLAI